MEVFVVVVFMSDAEVAIHLMRLIILRPMSVCMQYLNSNAVHGWKSCWQEGESA